MLARRVFDYHHNNQANKPVAPVNISVTVPPNELINYPPVAPPIPPPFTAPILEPVSPAPVTTTLLPSAIEANLASLADLIIQRLLSSVQDCYLIVAIFYFSTLIEHIFKKTFCTEAYNKI